MRKYAYWAGLVPAAALPVAGQGPGGENNLQFQGFFTQGFIKSIDGAGRKISKIIDVIEKIAFQTNILALIEDSVRNVLSIWAFLNLNMQFTRGRLAFVIALGTACFGQNVVPDRKAPATEKLGDIISDRPDFTESANVVGRGVMQVEYGTTIEKSGESTSLSSPEMLVRWGLTKRIEARFSAEGLHMERKSNGRGLRGFSDAEVGAKVALWGEKHAMPSLALIPFLSLPVGHRITSSQGFDPGLKVAWGKELPANFGLSGNVNVTRIGGPEARVKQWAWSLSLGHDLPWGFGGYIEAFRLSHWDVGEGAALIANGGITHSLGKNVQLDIRFGRKLTAAGPDWFTGFGVVLRRPGASYEVE